MARKSTKSLENSTVTIPQAVDTPFPMEWGVLAQQLNIGVPELQERVAAKINNNLVFTWENLPSQYEGAIASIQLDLESEVSVRKLEPQVESAFQPEFQETLVLEPPLLEEEPAPKAKKGTRKSSALTKKKTEAIAQGRAASKQTNQGVKQVLAKLQAQEGIKDAANAGTTYLQAFQATLNHVKGEGLTVLAAEMLQGLSAESDFTPDDILCDLGISLSTETQQALLEKLTPVLGKSELATQEILSTAWGNGIHLDAELTTLTDLLKSEI